MDSAGPSEARAAGAAAAEAAPDDAGILFFIAARLGKDKMLHALSQLLHCPS
jgi:hypothetical protein